jgi:hypothetical protein
MVPTFTYTFTHCGETRTTQLRKSNPQGWLLQAVTAAFPEVASRRADEIIRLRLEPEEEARQTWSAILNDAPGELVIRVTESRR